MKERRLQQQQKLLKQKPNTETLLTIKLVAARRENYRKCEGRANINRWRDSLLLKWNKRERGGQTKEIEQNGNKITEKPSNVGERKFVCNFKKQWHSKSISRMRKIEKKQKSKNLSNVHSIALALSTLVYDVLLHCSNGMSLILLLCMKLVNGIWEQSMTWKAKNEQQRRLIALNQPTREHQHGPRKRNKNRILALRVWPPAPKHQSNYYYYWRTDAKGQRCKEIVNVRCALIFCGQLLQSMLNTIVSENI